MSFVSRIEVSRLKAVCVSRFCEWIVLLHEEKHVSALDCCRLNNLLMNTWKISCREDNNYRTRYYVIRRHVQGGSNMTGTDLCVNKPHCAAAVRP